MVFVLNQSPGQVNCDRNKVFSLIDTYFGVSPQSPFGHLCYRTNGARPCRTSIRASQSTQASTEPKTCAQCKEKIQGSILTALGKSWHPDHFACEACKEPITETKFRTHEDKPYCTGCHIKHFANTCHACDEPILDKCVQAMGVNWHEDHFLCGGCKCKLIGTQFMDVKGAPFCQKCYLSKHADRCKGCSKPIADKAVVALDAKWHQMCFRCSKCDKPITSDQTFQVDQGKPQCVKC